jgi:predicted dienelactone hydrolase
LIDECSWVERGDDPRDRGARFEADPRDPRFVRAVAIDPGLAHAASADRLSGISAPLSARRRER